MAKVKCYYIDCDFLDDGYCSSSKIEVNPEEGCLTYTQFEEIDEVEDWGESQEEEHTSWESLEEQELQEDLDDYD